jgi:hypothetical protein
MLPEMYPYPAQQLKKKKDASRKLPSRGEIIFLPISYWCLVLEETSQTPAVT